MINSNLIHTHHDCSRKLNFMGMVVITSQVSSYKKVRKVIFVQSIPKSPAGKVLRRILKENLLNVSPNIISKM
jgi:acyl-coenzyme A synthetase/AMP-(fatty) acid ligase